MRDTADKVDLSACRLCVIRNRGSGKQDDQAETIRAALQDTVAEFALRETDRGDRLIHDPATVRFPVTADLTRQWLPPTPSPRPWRA